jgi:hypothetical protein
MSQKRIHNQQTERYKNPAKHAYVILQRHPPERLLYRGLRGVDSGVQTKHLVVVGHTA